MKSNFWHIWAIPLVLGGVSLLGLLAALVGDGFMDLISWSSLTVPLLVIGWFTTKPQSARDRQKGR